MARIGCWASLTLRVRTKSSATRFNTLGQDNGGDPGKTYLASAVRVAAPRAIQLLRERRIHTLHRLSELRLDAYSSCSQLYGHTLPHNLDIVKSPIAYLAQALALCIIALAIE
jgi:hypothetical protein